jgi:mono/diheme cytochrome c family protein
MIPIAACVWLLGGFTAGTRDTNTEGDRQIDMQKVLRGRQLVIEHACGNCHGGRDPSGDGWLVGWRESSPPGFQDFQVGPFHVYGRNLTPHNTTGLGRFSERQIFNALRFGLRPGETPDVEITSTTPGVGNFPEQPKYLAIPMPWTAWRHMADEDLRAIAAYLKHGVKPVQNRVPDSEGPPDFWASEYTPDLIGTYPAPAFPTANEVRPGPHVVDPARVRRGRQMVLEHACGECHGGMNNPAAEGWLAGVRSPDDEILIGPNRTFCPPAPVDACYTTRPRNLTPDTLTGIGRFSDRQIFNALRYGLRPGKTPDVEIASGVPGRGNFPQAPDYLAPAMPWISWRHMSDDDLWAIIAYLKHGLRPVHNDVAESEKPPDLWASVFTVEKIGTYPAPPFPTVNETRR